MCAIVAVTPPPDAESVELARRASASIVRRVHSAFPGAVEAIRTLHARGFTLHTASGESSRELAGYLEAMGVRDCFGRLFGPDLIDSHKAGPEFYTCLLADAGVAPEAALVVDDNPMVLGWATQVGAKTVLVGAATTDGFETTLRVGSLAELPEQIRSGWREMSGDTL
jgi:HAD superfamily hydrolase (TIGR01509 family)